MKHLPIILALLALAHAAAAQRAPRDTPRAAEPPTLAAAAAPTPVRPDGRLDEAAWSAAPVATGFTESYPTPGAPARHRTEVRVLFDRRALYVAMRMYDPAPDSIAAQLARRDASGTFSDWAHVVIDSYHDRRTAFRFSVNPRGVQRDLFHFNDTQEDAGWDAVWEAGTRIDSLGWTAEFRIPLSQLRFAGPAARHTWGIGFQRDVAREESRSSWSPWTPNDAGFVSRLGTLTGVGRLRPPSPLEIVPYTSARMERTPPTADPFVPRDAFMAGTGADLKYGTPSGLTLSATLNPDFAQVESDPAVVNLTALETFFPERRPFFAEGADLFRFGATRTLNAYGPGALQSFYSRRIGRRPQRELRPGSGVDGGEVAYANAPEWTRILGAAKLTGKTRDGWSVGLMNAVTAREEARYTLRGASDAGVGRVTAEPLSNYFMGRVQRDLRGGRTLAGGMATAVHRALDDAPLRESLRSSAYVAGVDGDHSWAGGGWNVNGFLAVSRAVGAPRAIAAAQRSSSRYFGRPDAEHLRLDTLRTSLQGYAAALTVSRLGGRHWAGSATLQTASPGFEVNDLGFQTRVDYHALSTYLRFQQNRAGRRLRGYAASVFTNHAWNHGGDGIFESYGAYGRATLASFWSLNGQVTLSPRTLTDRLTRGGPLAAVPRQFRASLGVDSDRRRPVAAGASLALRRDAAGDHDRSVEGWVEARPSPWLRLRLEPSLSARRDVDQFIRSLARGPGDQATFGRRYVFAELDQVTAALGVRADWTFTPTLSLQLYAQPLVSSGAYEGFKELAAPRTHDFAVYGRDLGTVRAEDGGYTVEPGGGSASLRIADPDFTVRSLRGNAVLRWEYRRGSTLFFVWQQQRSGSEVEGAFDLERDAAAVFRDPARNRFIVKASYWIGS